MTNCPACSSTKSKPTQTIGVQECAKCGAIYGSCYLGESYGIVKPAWAPADVPADRTRHFDLECLGSQGITRRHGWFDPETRLITQVG